MRKVLHLIILVSCILFNTVSAQIADPIHWSFHTTNISACEVELVFEAKLEGSWHLYGQKSYGEDGPVPTSFHFTTDSTYELIGSTSEETLIEKFEPVFGAELNYFEHKALFKQKIKIKSPDSIKIKGDFEYMVCNEVTCMPPTTLPFLFAIEGSGDCANGSTSEQSWWTIFVIGFLGGFAALLTPCVFPLIPLTVSFFTKQSNTRTKGISNALLYSFTIIAIYVTLGLVVTSIFGSTALHSISTSIWYLSVPRLFFAILALSFTMYLIPGLWGAPLKLIHGFPPPDFYKEAVQLLFTAISE